MARALLLLLLLLAGIACASSPSADAVASDHDQLWWRARGLFEQQQFRAAASLFEQLAAQHPGAAPNATVEVALAASYYNSEELELARVHFERALALRPNDANVLGNLGFLHYDAGRYALALNFLQRALALDPSLAPITAHARAVSTHFQADYTAAEALFEQVPEARRTAHYHYDRGVTLERLGKILEAGDAYNAAIEMAQQFAPAWHNIAALHQRYGEATEAIRCYLNVLRIPSTRPGLRLMALTNLGIAYETTDDVASALRYYARAQEQLQRLPEDDSDSDTPVQLQIHIARAKRTACIWDGVESERDAVLRYVQQKQLERGGFPSLQPFDTLLWSMDGALRLAVARAHSDAVASAAAAMFAESPPLDEEFVEDQDRRQLRVGYASYDFSDHPTAHLLEGVFAAHDRRDVLAIAFGYGKDDGSAFRARLLNLVDEFVNLAAAATRDSVREVRARRLDIFMDAQGHTRGSRMQITAARPAPVVVNYLVYPGTSGAPFVDYVTADRFVAPPDAAAAHFSEKLVLLPRSYQVNYYPAAVVPHSRASLWRPSEDEAEDDDHDDWGFTFVNFNKIDKIEPTAFSLWMAVLRRVPRSRLLLLNPARDETRPSKSATPTTAEEIVRNLKLEAAAHGVAASRLQFVPRVAKHDHLRRHRRGGLFLDTLVYGAHSTATDALYAGLPVLTLAGDVFASRVAVSLLHNVALPELVTHSRKEFEDLAVAIATDHTVLLTRLRERLRTPDDVEVPPLFRTREHVAALETAQRVMATLHRSAALTASHQGETLPRSAHIIVVD